jgi:Na+-transporting NADH:ubiquinone oxidoreductase subunit NqrA
MLKKLTTVFDQMAVALGLKEETLKPLSSEVFSRTRATGLWFAVETRTYMTAEPVDNKGYNVFKCIKMGDPDCTDPFKLVSKVVDTDSDGKNILYSGDGAKKRLEAFAAEMRPRYQDNRPFAGGPNPPL